VFCAEVIIKCCVVTAADACAVFFVLCFLCGVSGAAQQVEVVCTQPDGGWTVDSFTVTLSVNQSESVDSEGGCQDEASASSRIDIVPVPTVFITPDVGVGSICAKPANTTFKYSVSSTTGEALRVTAVSITANVTCVARPESGEFDTSSERATRHVRLMLVI